MAPSSPATAATVSMGAVRSRREPPFLQLASCKASSQVFSRNGLAPLACSRGRTLLQQRASFSLGDSSESGNLSGLSNRAPRESGLEGFNATRLQSHLGGLSH